MYGLSARWKAYEGSLPYVRDSRFETMAIRFAAFQFAAELFRSTNS